MKNVLIADRDIILQKALKKIIETEGFNVLGTASNLEELKEYGTRYKPDVVVSSISFPDGVCFNTLHDLEQQHPSMEVCLISAYEQPEFIRKAFSVHARAYLSKPLCRKEFVSVLKDFKHSENESEYYGDVILLLAEIIEACDYSRTYYDLARVADTILQISGRNNQKTAEILREVKTRLVSKYIENPFGGDETDDIMPINVDFLENETVLEMWLYHFLDFIYKYRFSEKHKSIRPVFNYIDEHIKEYICMGDIVDNCHISTQYILRLFKKQMNMSALGYIQQRKMMLAKWYLYFGSMSAQDVGSMVGYDDSGYFAKIFKKYEGLTPYQYRRQFAAEASGRTGNRQTDGH